MLVLHGGARSARHKRSGLTCSGAWRRYAKCTSNRLEEYRKSSLADLHHLPLTILQKGSPSSSTSDTRACMASLTSRGVSIATGGAHGSSISVLADPFLLLFPPRVRNCRRASIILPLPLSSNELRAIHDFTLPPLFAHPLAEQQPLALHLLVHPLPMLTTLPLTGTTGVSDRSLEPYNTPDNANTSSASLLRVVWQASGGCRLSATS